MLMLGAPRIGRIWSAEYCCEFGTPRIVDCCKIWRCVRIRGCSIRAEPLESRAAAGDDDAHARKMSLNRADHNAAVLSWHLYWESIMKREAGVERALEQTL